MTSYKYSRTYTPILRRVLCMNCYFILGSDSLPRDVTLQVKFNVSHCFSTIECPDKRCVEENSNSYACSVNIFVPGNRKIKLM